LWGSRPTRTAVKSLNSSWNMRIMTRSWAWRAKL